MVDGVLFEHSSMVYRHILDCCPLLTAKCARLRLVKVCYHHCQCRTKFKFIQESGRVHFVIINIINIDVYSITTFFVKLLLSDCGLIECKPRMVGRNFIVLIL